MTISYNLNIPNAPNNPSADQPLMQVNTNSINTIIGVDHVTFQTPNGGFHNQARIINQASIPAGLISGIGTLYTKLSGESELFYTPDTTTNEYQLTRTITASFALFGKNTNNYNGVGANFTGGWTFLPGGLLYQYGNFNQGAGGINPSTGTISFPVTFTTSSSINVLVTPICKVGGTSQVHTVSVITGTISTTGFQWNYDSTTSSYVGLSWIAIGI